MKYEDFCRQMELRERKASHKNDLIAEDFIKKYLKKICKNELSYKTGSPIDDLLYEYFKIKGTEKEIAFQNLLNSYNFNYSMSIHKAIYYLLATQREFTDKIAWPGVYNISTLESKYILETILGTIEVYKANEIFFDSASYYIFEKING